MPHEERENTFKAKSIPLQRIKKDNLDIHMQSVSFICHCHMPTDLNGSSEFARVFFLHFHVSAAFLQILPFSLIVHCIWKRVICERKCQISSSKA